MRPACPPPAAPQGRPPRARPTPTWAALAPWTALVLSALLYALPQPDLRAEEPAAPVQPVSPPAPSLPPADPLVVGTFELQHLTSVVDGDTLRVLGQAPIRVLCLDCEEVFHAAADRAAAEVDFDAYARAKRGTSPVPVKFGTPAGAAATEFVRAFLEGVERVRLERDEVGGHDVDAYERRLAHVLVLRATGEQNLAVEVVRAGHSPYFVKYGRSRRFHAEFVAAQAQARAALRGIWGAQGPRHYPDYDERLAWWEQRALQLDFWRALPAAPTRIELGTEQASERLMASVGQVVVVFGAAGRMRLDAWPRLIWLAHKRGADLTLVVRDAEVWAALDLDTLARRFVTVTGPVSLYQGRPQIEITDPLQVSTR